MLTCWLCGDRMNVWTYPCSIHHAFVHELEAQAYRLGWHDAWDEGCELGFGHVPPRPREDYP